MIKNFLFFGGYFFIFFSIIVLIFTISGVMRMKNLYTKAHFLGIIDNFVAPCFLFGAALLILEKFFYSFLGWMLFGKVFLMMVFLCFASVISTHSICKTYFEKMNNQNED